MLWLTLGLFAAISGPVSQWAEPPAQPPLARTSVTTVLVDATVTDPSGRQVPTLGADDFIVTQDGRRLRVTLARHIGARATDARLSVAPGATNAGLSEAPGFSRAITDLRHSGSTIGFVVDAGGLLPVDKERALAAIARETAGLDPADVVTRLTSRTPRRGAGEGPLLETVASLLDEWAGRPGRKCLVIFSAGIVAKAAPAPGAVRLPDAMVMARLRAIARAADRAHAVLYPVNVPRFDAWVASRHALLDSPYDRAAEGPGFLAEATGGVFFKNPGDLAIAAARAVADQQGYYLLGVEIDDALVPAGARLRLDVRVRQAGLHVRTHPTLPSLLPD